MDTITIKVDDLSNVSDGYHTIQELYEHRIILYLQLCKARKALGDDVWRSRLHSDGSAYPEWFVLGIGRKPGQQITYHLSEEQYWEMTDFVETLERAPAWDGHTPGDVLERLKNLSV